MERIPINEKYSLTIQEASEYFSIGVKKMRRLAEENVGRFSVFSGNRYLILREKFETFLSQCSAISSACSMVRVGTISFCLYCLKFSLSAK